MLKTSRELSAVLAGLRLLQRSAIPGTSVYDVPDSVLPILDDGGQEPLKPSEIDSLCERLNVDIGGLFPPDLEQLEPNGVRALVAEAIRTLGSAVAWNADAFESDLNVSGGDLVEFFGGWRQEAWETIGDLRRVMARLSSDIPMQAEPMVRPRPVMVAAFEQEAATEAPRQAVITLKSGIAHCLREWTIETEGGTWRLESSPIPGSFLVLDASDVASVLFMDVIPDSMFNAAYDVIPEQVSDNARPRTLDD